MPVVNSGREEQPQILRYAQDDTAGRFKFVLSHPNRERRV